MYPYNFFAPFCNFRLNAHITQSDLVSLTTLTTTWKAPKTNIGEISIQAGLVRNVLSTGASLGTFRIPAASGSPTGAPTAAPPATPGPATMAPPANQASTYVSTSGDFSVSWSADSVAKRVTFTVKCKCTGWVSLGILVPGGSTAHMDAMDVYTGGVSGGIPYLKNYFQATGAGAVVPIEDPTQTAIKIESATETGSGVNGQTTLIFSRALDTGNKALDVALSDSISSFTYGYHVSNDAPASRHDTSNSAGWYFKANVFGGLGAADAPPAFFMIEPGTFLSYAILLTAVIVVVVRFAYRCFKIHRAYNKPKQSKSADNYAATLEVVNIPNPVKAEAQISDPPPLPGKKKSKWEEVKHRNNFSSAT